MKLTRTTLALFAAVLVIPMAAVGQDKDVIENTVVATQKSPGELRRDFWRAERDFYAIYNRLNEDGLYDVRCTKEAPTGSMIKTQTCRPKFVDRAIKEGKFSKGGRLDSNSEIEAQMATYRKKLETLVAANSELQSAAAALNLAHAQLQADIERRASK
ncbi:MAG: hypothetical protein QNJ07_09245 [Woeseiaceae bacterium]|nr:hypothetical protein [Woeseiaceae bacterium]